jgi:hypothetical protein
MTNPGEKKPLLAPANDRPHAAQTFRGRSAFLRILGMQSLRCGSPRPGGYCRTFGNAANKPYATNVTQSGTGEFVPESEDSCDGLRSICRCLLAFQVGLGGVGRC